MRRTLLSSTGVFLLTASLVLLTACDSGSSLTAPDASDDVPETVATTQSISGPGSVCSSDTNTYTESSSCSDTISWGFREAGSTGPYYIPFPNNTGSSVDISFYVTGYLELRTACSPSSGADYYMSTTYVNVYDC